MSRMSPKKQAQDRDKANFKSVDSDSSSTASGGAGAKIAGALAKHIRKVENPFANEFVPAKKRSKSRTRTFNTSRSKSDSAVVNE